MKFEKSARNYIIIIMTCFFTVGIIFITHLIGVIFFFFGMGISLYFIYLIIRKLPIELGVLFGLLFFLLGITFVVIFIMYNLFYSLGLITIFSISLYIMIMGILMIVGNIVENYKL
ncbi:MAG: hypothetical protein ACFE9S_20555 [Candidatus Hermodarchaeota archaeon]